MSTLSIIVLLAASFAAGIMNTLAGGGSFLTFPSLLLSGLNPLAANITSTIALFPMQVSSGYAGRSMAGDTPQLSFKALFGLSLIGGVIGAWLLIETPASFFQRLVPWLILFATAVFAYGSFIKKPSDLAKENAVIGKRGAVICQLLISIYGGYFGGGIGFLMLAALTLTGMDVRKAGATKNILAGVMNASAVIVFAICFFHNIGWMQVGISAFGSIIGGLIGVRCLHRVNERILRIAVVCIGTVLTIAMFVY